MLTKLLAIIRNTFMETIRQPIFGLLVLVIMGCLTVNTAVAAFTTSPSEELYDDNKMMYDLGLSTLLIGGLFLAGFSSAGVLSREIENKTVLTVISKPVSRPIFVIGKFLGLAGALTVGCYLTSATFFLAARHGVMQSSTQHFDWPVLLFGLGALFLTFGIATFCNYFYGWQFCSTCLALGAGLLTLACVLVGFIDREWRFQSFAKEIRSTQLSTAVLLVYFAVMVLTAVSMVASTRLGQVMTLLVCFVVLALGLMSDYFFQPYAFPTYKPLAATQPAGGDIPAPATRPAESPGPIGLRAGTQGPNRPGQAASEESEQLRPRLARATGKSAQLLARVVYAVIPNMQFYWVSDAVILRRPIPASYVLRLFGYTLFYVVALVILAIALFQTREVAAEDSASTAPPVVHLLGVVGRVVAALQVTSGLWSSLTEAVKPSGADIRYSLAFAALGVFLWFFWGWFARGMKWTWFVAVILVGFYPLAHMAYVLYRYPGSFNPTFALPGVAAILVLTILGKSSRVYFGFGKDRRRRRRTRAEPNAG
jgi:ABC-2 type transport system permease protein